MKPATSALPVKILLGFALLVPVVISFTPAGEPKKVEGMHQVFRGHDDAVYDVAFTPNGKFLITGSFDNTAKMFDVATGKEVRTFGGSAGHNKMVLSVAVSPDGFYLATAGLDNQMRLWDVPSTSPLRKMAATAEINGAALSADGNKIATAGKDGVVRLFDSKDFKQLFELKGHTGEVKSVSFSPNNALLASSGSDGILRLWNVGNGQLVNVIGAHTGPVNYTMIHPNNTVAYSVGQDGMLRFWQINNINAPRTFPDLPQSIVAFAVSNDGNQVLTASADNSIRVSNFANGQPLRQYEKSNVKTMSAAFNSNASQVVTGMADGSVVAWNNGDGKILASSPGHIGAVNSVSIRPQNDQLLTGGQDGIVKNWALPLVPQKSFANPAEVLAGALNSDGTKIFLAGKDNFLRVWNLQNNQMERQFSGHTAPVTAVAVSPNNALLASASEDATIRFWDQNNGQPTHQIGAHSAPITALRFNNANNQVLSASKDGTVKLWQAPPTPPQTLTHPDQVTSAVITPNGAHLITGSTDKNVRLWNLGNGQAERTYGGHNLPITAVEVSGNGQFVIGGSDDKSFSVWNLGNGQLVKKIETSAPVKAVALNGDGKQALVGLADNSLHVFSVEDGKEIKKLDGHTGAITTVIALNNGAQYLSSSADKSVKLWNMPDGAAKSTFTHGGPIQDIAVSKDGKLLAAASGKSVKIWKLADGQEVTGITSQGDITSLAFSPDGNRLVVGEQSNRASIYGLDGQFQEYFMHTGPVLTVDFHNDNKRIISAGADKLAQVWTPALIWMQNHGGPVTDAVITAKNIAISSGTNKLVKLWNAADGKELKAIPAHNAEIVDLDVNGDGSKLATIAADKSIKIWEIGNNDPKEIASLAAVGNPTGVTISPNGEKIAVSSAAEKAFPVEVFSIAQKQKLQEFTNHGSAVPVLLFHGDNRTLSTAGLDKSVHTVNVGVLGAFEAHPGGVSKVQFNNTGTQAITAGADKTVKHWDLAQGKVIRTFGPFANPVTDLAYSKDFSQIALATGNDAIILQLADGKELRKIAHPAKVTTVAWNNDKSRLLTGCDDKNARVWETASGQLLQYFPANANVVGVAVHNNNNDIMMAAGSAVTVATQANQRAISAANGPITALTILSNGSHVFTGSDEKIVKMWNTANGNKDREFSGAAGTVKGLAVSKNNQMLAVGGADKILRIFNVNDAKEVKTTPAPGEILSANFSPNSQLLGISCSDNSVIVYDTNNFNPNNPPDSFLKPVQSFAHAGPAVSVDFAPDNTTVVSAGLDKMVQAWKLASPNPLNNQGHPNIVDVVVFSPDGKLVATGCHDGHIRIYDVEKKNLVKDITAHKEKDQTMIYSLAFTSDSEQIASGSYDRSVKLWNVKSGALVKDFPGYKEKDAEQGHKDSIFSVAISPDGKYLASGSGGLERVIKLWDIGTGKVIREFANDKITARPGRKSPPSHPGWVYKLRFSKDGTRLFSAGDAPRNKGYVAIWNVADGKLVGAKEMALGAYYGLAVSPDGQWLALGAGTRGRPDPALNSAYLLKVDEIK